MTEVKKTRGRPFLPGNKAAVGRAKRTPAARLNTYRDLMMPMVPELLAKAYALAMDGDIGAMKLILDRAVPIRTVTEQEFADELAELRALLEERQTKEVSVQ